MVDSILGKESADPAEFVIPAELLVLFGQDIFPLASDCLGAALVNAMHIVIFVSIGYKGVAFSCVHIN